MMNCLHGLLTDDSKLDGLQLITNSCKIVQGKNEGTVCL